MRQQLLTACVILAVTAPAAAQYADFFQGLTALLQPLTTKRPHIATKRTETKHKAKPKYEDFIFFEPDDKEESYSSAKKKSSQEITPTTKSKLVNSNKINGNRNHDVRSIINDPYKNNLEYNNNYNIPTTQINQQTTKKATQQNYVTQQHHYATQNSRYTSQQNGYTTQQSHYTTHNRHNEHNWNYDTTTNPLLNRPGVKPAAVDENQPPITNKPVTSDYDIPFGSGYRPVNTRPPYETEKPRVQTRPANTRPPFEVERPATTKPDEDKEPVIEIGPDEDQMSEAEKRRYYELCEEKCEQYKSANTRKVVALPLAGNQRAEFNVSSCARANVPLIIGGEVVDIKQFPHMALVGWKKLQGEGYSWKCGGSLLSHRHVLTAGHCTYYDKDDNIVSGPPRAVQLGATRMDGPEAAVVRVAAAVRHHQYRLRRSYYDIAVLRLVHVISFSDKISPACLGVPPPEGSPIVATGWGKTEFGGEHSAELRSVSLPVWDMGACRAVWGASRKLPQGPRAATHVCAGEPRGQRDTCQGDSGGPAQIQDGCVWRVVAVTSVGRSCGAPDTPALYAKVPRAFIAAVVYKDEDVDLDGYNRGESGGNGGSNSGNGQGNWGNSGDNGQVSGNVGNQGSRGSGQGSAGNQGSRDNTWDNTGSLNRGNTNRGDTVNRGGTNDRGIDNWSSGGNRRIDNTEGRDDNRGSESIWGNVRVDGPNNNRGSVNNDFGGNSNVANVRPNVNNEQYPNNQPDNNGYNDQQTRYVNDNQNNRRYETPRTTTVKQADYSAGYGHNGYNDRTTESPGYGGYEQSGYNNQQTGYNRNTDNGYNRNNDNGYNSYTMDSYYPAGVSWWT